MTSAPPRIAIISNAQTPYRAHVHERIARELPEVELWSAFTHQFSNAPWQIQTGAESRALYLGEGERSEDSSRIGNQRNEWRKGKTLLRWLVHNHIRFVLLEGYNDAGRVRVLLACRRLRIPCFLFGDSNILADRPGPLKALLKRLAVGSIVRQASGLMYCGKLGRRYFQRYGAAENRLFPFPYEPDYSVFENVPQSGLDTVKARYGLKPGRRYLIFSGRFVSVKRVDLLLRAFSEVAASRPEWDLILIGDGPLREEFLAALAPEIRARIVTTGFLSDPAAIAALYRCGDVLVLPSDVEPWGVVVTEAAMAQLALICSSVTGAGVELVREGANGRLFGAGSFSELRDAILDVTRPENTSRMKAASRGILTEWRRTSDPVDGLRASLRFAGVIP